MIAWLYWLGCNGPTPGGTDTEEPTAETGTVDTGTRFVGTGDLDATCTRRGEHPSLFDCTVRLPEPGSVQLVAWWEDDETRTRTLSSTTPALEHELLLWGLKPDTRYLWRAEATLLSGESQHRTGRVRTWALPVSFAPRYEVLTDTPDATVDGLLNAVSCAPGRPHIIDDDGDVIWFVNLREKLASKESFAIHGLEWTDAGTILVLLGRHRVVELTLGGEIGMVLDRGVHFEHAIHHDLARHDGHTYVPYAEAVQRDGDEFVVDGLYVFDGKGTLVDEVSFEDTWPLVAEKWTLDGYWSSRFPNAYDPLHANSVSIDDEGDVVVSFRHLHAVAGFRGGPGELGFGVLDWTLVGQPTSVAAPGTFAIAADPPIAVDFSGQHDAHFVDGQTLLMLDNRLVAKDSTRAVELTLDERRGEAQIVAEYPVGASCPIQGTARKLPSGNVVTTCSSASLVSEHRAGASGPVWEARVSCGAGLPSAALSRALPVVVPP
ncbi:MAG: aryl-sulfate sulfotransferase [Myxococcales bacterium]|nr:aryl-sulfate sulfotransferase [Myxococcales bacterium]